jgi:hypothetical protein
VAQWDALADLLAPEIALPIVGARFVAGVDSEGKRQSNFQMHYEDETVTPMEVVGLVQVSLWEWVHGVLHERDTDG